MYIYILYTYAVTEDNGRVNKLKQNNPFGR